MPNLDYRVKLRSTVDQTDFVIFNVTPDLSESKTVNYKTVDPVHSPGQIYAFLNSSSRMFQLSAVKLMSRTQQEADENLRILWKLRGWTMPAFGADPIGDKRVLREKEIEQRKKDLKTYGTNNSVYEDAVRRRLNGKTSVEVYGRDLRGAPPQVLELSAYSLDGQYSEVMGHINRVPVVITSLNIPYPSDVDYFPGSDGTPMPFIMSIDISLAETHSPREYEKFSLESYKKGILAGF